jgi:hypothetical protein
MQTIYYCEDIGMFSHSLLCVTDISMVQMKCSISSCLHKFKDAAKDAVNEEFKCQGLKTDAAKAEFIHFLIGDPNDISSKNRPFIWESIYNDPKAEQQVMVSFTLM